MSTHRWAAKRDAAEGPIVEALRAVGAEVWFISGKGLPDLLVRYKGSLAAGEVKSKGGKETENQGDFPVWRTPEEALRAIGLHFAALRGSLPDDPGTSADVEQALKDIR